jgi:hypothetical protein
VKRVVRVAAVALLAIPVLGSAAASLQAHLGVPPVPTWVKPDGRSVDEERLGRGVPVAEPDGRLRRDSVGNLVLVNPSALRGPLFAPEPSRLPNQPTVASEHVELPPHEVRRP